MIGLDSEGSYFSCPCFLPQPRVCGHFELLHLLGFAEDCRGFFLAQSAWPQSLGLWSVLSSVPVRGMPLSPLALGFVKSIVGRSSGEIDSSTERDNVFLASVLLMLRCVLCSVALPVLIQRARVDRL